MKGAVTLKFETLKMTQDRGRTFWLDSMDVDETNFIASAGAVMGEFQRTQVVPEIDAYRYSKLAAECTTENTSEGYTPVASTILAKLKEDIFKIQDVAGDVALVISMSMFAAKILSDTPDIQET